MKNIEAVKLRCVGTYLPGFYKYEILNIIQAILGK